jgi:hypothetical protein
MSRGALITGTVGGIFGTISSALGIFWIIAVLAMTSSWTFMLLIAPLKDHIPGIVFMVLGIVALILVGIGFYGLYSLGGSSMGVVALIFGILGAVGYVILVLGEFGNSILAVIGWLILLVSYIIIGIASITLREVTTNPGAALAAGILSIIGGIFAIGLIGFVLLFVAYLLWAIVFYTTEA